MDGAGQRGVGGPSRPGGPGAGIARPTGSPKQGLTAPRGGDRRVGGAQRGGRQAGSRSGASGRGAAARNEAASGPLGLFWRRPRLQVRSVRRILRRVELWSVLKISLIFYVCLWAILLVAGMILWNVVSSLGYVEAAADFIARIFALESFEFNSRQIFRVYALGGLVGVLFATLFSVVAAVLFNLISELVGGLRIVLVEEESTRFRPAKKYSRARRRR